MASEYNGRKREVANDLLNHRSHATHIWERSNLRHCVRRDQYETLWGRVCPVCTETLVGLISASRRLTAPRIDVY